MELATKILVGVIALEHLYILYIEMFAWETSGKKTFKGALPEDLFKSTKGLAANQGLYNGFLAAGLIWSLCIDNVDWSKNISIFFLSCIIIAGLYGTFRSTRSIFFKQALPAIVTLLFVLFF